MPVKVISSSRVAVLILTSVGAGGSDGSTGVADDAGGGAADDGALLGAGAVLDGALDGEVVVLLVVLAVPPSQLYMVFRPALNPIEVNILDISSTDIPASSLASLM